MQYHHVRLREFQAPIIEIGDKGKTCFIVEKDGDGVSLVTGVLRVVVPLFKFQSDRHLGEKLIELRNTFLRETNAPPGHLVFVESAGRCGLVALQHLTALPGDWTTYEAGFEFEGSFEIGEA